MSITILADRRMTRPQAVGLARRMWDSGWTFTEIQRYLAEHGQSAARSTIHGWVDAEWKEAQLARKRRAKREKRLRDRGEHVPVPVARLTPDVLLALRVEDGLSYSAIAAVARRFFGEDMSESQARYRLGLLGAPTNPNKSRAVAAQHQRRKAAA